MGGVGGSLKCVPSNISVSIWLILNNVSRVDAGIVTISSRSCISSVI